MVAFPLPPGETDGLHQRLRQDYGLEVPVYDWQGRRLIRVSCHLYNSADQIDRLAAALRELL
jgi:isopenicillin-N epimerase